MTDIKSWLHKKYLDWMVSTGERQTYKNFAAYIGVSQQTLSGWMNSGITPTGDNVHLLADKLGPEIYEILGVDPPERRMREVRAAYNEITDEAARDELQKRIYQVITDFFEEYGFKREK